MSTVRSARCRTSATRSYWLAAVVTVVAMLGFAGILFADTGNNQGTKLLPPNHDPRLKKIVAHMGDAEPGAPAAPHTGTTPLAPPANDDCTGAIAIPAGSYPVSSAAVDTSQATPASSDGSAVEPFCASIGIDQTVWFSFTPTTTGVYKVSTCHDDNGTTVYDTAFLVTDSCPSGTEIVCQDAGAGCSPLAGAPYTDEAIAGSVAMTAGTTYYIAAGHWAGDVGGDTGAFSNVAVTIDISPVPVNDTCASPTPLSLDRITFGSTASANNDYRSIGCNFFGPGQLPTTANGADVVFSFLPPSNDLYSFRFVMDDSASPLRSQSPVLYMSDQCPAPNNTVGVPDCFAAANRMNDSTTGNNNRSEELNCIPLTGGTPYYLFFDDRFTGNAGGPLAIEVSRCKPEIEPNDSIATATPYAPNQECFMEGAAIPSGPTADIDFYDLGAPPAGSKIFAAVDAAASTTNDYEMRITNATDTLGYDDNDGTSIIGSNAPIVAGPFADGTEIYARVNGKTASTGMEPYRLYARIETGAAENEFTPDTSAANALDRFVTAKRITGGGFVKGISSSLTDFDCFNFVARPGDNILMFSDNNPSRAAGTINNVFPIIFTPEDAGDPSRTGFTGQVLRNVVTASPGTLSGTTPSVTSEYHSFMARFTGMYSVCYGPIGDATDPPASSYPLPYQGSISINCGPVPGPATGVDVAVAKSGPTGPVNTGTIFNYTITLTNNDPNGVAESVRLVDTLPPEVNFESLSVVDGFAGKITGVFSLPTPGANDAPIDVEVLSIAPGFTVTFTVTVQLNNCIGAGHSVVNSASITSATGDPNSANDSASWTFTTSEDGSCVPTLCSANGCIVDRCSDSPTSGNSGSGQCVAGQCTSTPHICDDHSVCTADSCDPTKAGNPCVFDSSQLGDLCFDGNDCTRDTCDPVLFCQFPPSPAGQACNDFLNCTTNDQCDGAGSCVGHSVCDDGMPCTDDFADEANNCACDNPISFQGTVCDDGNACTTGTTCDGNGGSVADCNGGTAVNCDDGNPCTDDSCDPSLGCVHTNNTAPCSDGNACTVGDTCGGGTCNPGTPAVCDDGNACNGVETCNPATGCVAGTPPICNDGNACNGVETCNPSTGCVAGTPLNCDDGNGCTDDSCNPASGCVHTNNTAPCSDGNACTTGDHCSGGSCVPGGPTNCDDGDCCTIDSCNPSTGCVHTANPTTPVFTTQPSFGNIILWSPNHGYVDFTVADTGAAATDACGTPTISFASCASSQPENANGTGDGNSLRDCVYEPGALHLRAERDGACSPIGRVYTTRLIAVDACGHTALSNPTSIPVWHDRAHPPVQGSVRFSTGNTNDTRNGTNGTYGTDCGAGEPQANGTAQDHSDADPEMEISQQAAITVDTLRINKGTSGSLLITWTAPVQNGQVTRYHVWKLDPLTLFWTQIAEVSKQTTSWTEPADGSSWQYKVSAVIK